MAWTPRTRGQRLPCLPSDAAHPARRLLPYLRPALEVLLYAEADTLDVVDVLLLLNQLMARFKDALAPIMQVSWAAPAWRRHLCTAGTHGWCPSGSTGVLAMCAGGCGLCMSGRGGPLPWSGAGLAERCAFPAHLC